MILYILHNNALCVVCGAAAAVMARMRGETELEGV